MHEFIEYDEDHNQKEGEESNNDTPMLSSYKEEEKGRDSENRDN